MNLHKSTFRTTFRSKKRCHTFEEKRHNPLNYALKEETILSLHLTLSLQNTVIKREITVNGQVPTYCLDGRRK